jgi:hypothetical protein
VAVSGQGFALRNQLKCGAVCGRYRGINTLVRQSTSDATPVVVTDLLFEVTSGTQNLTASRFDNSQTFYAATVTPGAVTLSPGLFSNSQTFYAATVTQPSGGTQNLTASLFTNSQTFYAATVSPGAVSLAAARFDNSQSFYAPTVTPGAVTLSPALFTNTQTFFAPYVYDPADLEPSSIRFDITTGRLVKIINQSVCISF